jgi:DNA invertase Pin-like site-specific DNA recombinase
LGLDAQRVAVTAEAERRGWQLVDVMVDAGASGKSLTGRPALADALALLEKGHADALIVAKLDRLSRSVLDFAGVLARAERRGWALIALDLGVDTTTPAGRMVANVMAAVAEWERSVIAQRTKDAMAVAKARGVHCGRARETDDDTCRRIVAMRESGVSFARIANALNAERVPTTRGGSQWFPSTAQRVYSSVAAA